MKPSRPILFPALLASLCTFSAMAEDSPATLNAAMDVQYRWSNSAALSNGFTIQDASIYVAKESGPAEMKIDLPFKWSSATNNDFDFATGKAQAYLAYKTAFDVQFKAGQFDSIFGYEPGDSHERFHTDPGIIGVLNPTTHTGALFSYEVSKNLGLNLVISNPNNQGALNEPGIASGNNLEYAAQANFNADIYTLSVGGRIQKQNATTTSSQYNFVIGADLAPFNVTAEVDTLSLGSQFPESPLGAAAYLTYAATDRLTLGTRIEILKNEPDLTNLSVTDRKLAITLGPSLKLTPEFRVRADAQWLSIRATPAAEAEKSTSGNLSAVYCF